jgi:hypothetical protein
LGDIFSGFVLFLTVLMAVGLGILAGYGAFLAILQSLMARQDQPVPVLVPSQSHASGD